jgi:hypothetical protein
MGVPDLPGSDGLTSDAGLELVPRYLVSLRVVAL